MQKVIMIELLKSLPANVIGFRADGDINQEDYHKIVFPEVKRFAETHKKLNYVFFVDTPLTEFSMGAWIQDAWLGMKELARWHKVAIVSDEKKVRAVTNTAGRIVPGEYRGFGASELDKAIEWAAKE
jgi:hypothetical protein